MSSPTLVAKAPIAPQSVSQKSAEVVRPKVVAETQKPSVSSVALAPIALLKQVDVKKVDVAQLPQSQPVKAEAEPSKPIDPKLLRNYKGSVAGPITGGLLGLTTSTSLTLGGLFVFVGAGLIGLGVGVVLGLGFGLLYDRLHRGVLKGKYLVRLGIATDLHEAYKIREKLRANNILNSHFGRKNVVLKIMSKPEIKRVFPEFDAEKVNTLSQLLVELGKKRKIFA